MDTSIISKGYLTNTKRFKQAAEGLTADEALFRPYDKANSPLWEIGHITFFRNTVIKLLNPAEKLSVLPFEKEFFGLGSHPSSANDYPSLETVLDHFEQRGLRIAELLPTVTPEHLAAESPFKIPTLGVTIGQQVFSFLIHEANHYGELHYVTTLVRRLRVPQAS